jgi:hypothetical protein
VSSLKSILWDFIVQLYLFVPERARYPLKYVFYRLNPRQDWAQKKLFDETREKREKAKTEFVSQFLSKGGQLESYEEEFRHGKVPKFIGSALEDLSAETAIHDIHDVDAIRYYSIIREKKPDVVVETGVHNGISTLTILSALRQNGYGHLYSIDSSNTSVREDRPNHYTREGKSAAMSGSEMVADSLEPGWLIPDELRDDWTLIEGNSRRELPLLLDRLNGVDVFLHDSDHSRSTILFEFTIAWEHLTDGGVILSHHTARNDAFETFTEEHHCESGSVHWWVPNGPLDIEYPRQSAFIVKPADDAERA